ncbi:MAG: hypothetical protein IIA77_05325 [Proteobacteria bacterium]|nr:hypothetical protein [Pseudomonadota bacterium]
MPRLQGRHTGRISVARGQESVATAHEWRFTWILMYAAGARMTYRTY